MSELKRDEKERLAFARKTLRESAQEFHLAILGQINAPDGISKFDEDHLFEKRIDATLHLLHDAYDLRRYDHSPIRKVPSLMDGLLCWVDSFHPEAVICDGHLTILSMPNVRHIDAAQIVNLDEIRGR